MSDRSWLGKIVKGLQVPYRAVRNAEQLYDIHLRDHVDAGKQKISHAKNRFVDNIIENSEMHSVRKYLLHNRIEDHAEKITYLEQESNSTGDLLARLRDRADDPGLSLQLEAAYETVIDDQQAYMEGLQTQQVAIERQLKSDVEKLKALKGTDPDSRIDDYIGKGLGLLHTVESSIDRAERTLTKIRKVHKIITTDRRDYNENK